MNGDGEVFDHGLQPERTALAWRRTALSLALGGLVSLRLLPMIIGDALWVVPGFVLGIGAIAVWLTGERRYREFFRNEVPTPHAPFGAWPLLLTAAGTALLGCGGLVLVLILVTR